MKGCLKSAVILAGIVLILGAVASLLLMAQADTWLKRGAEAGISVAAGAPVRIERLRIMPLRQCMEIQGLAVENPPGWKAGSALTVESVLVNLDAKTLFSKTPRVKQVDIQGATVNLRYDAAQGWNLSKLVKMPGIDNAGGVVDKLGRRFQIESCQCRDVKVCLSGGIVPDKLVALDLQPFTLENIEQNPVTVAQSTSIFLRSVVAQTLSLNGLLKPVQTELRNWLGI